MKKITVKNRIILVDDDDLLRITKYSWQINHNGYACRNHWNKRLKKYEKMYMHRFIMGTPNGMDTDHINRNKLDNRKMNLRAATRSRNNHNSGPPKSNTSGTKGVNWFKPAKLWRAYITIDKKRTDLGYSKSKSGAILLRKQAELKYGIQS